MAGKIDYKQKYQELKAKFMSSVDSAWQDGYQHGMQDSQVEQATQQQQQNDAMAMAANSQPQPEQEGEQPKDPGQEGEGQSQSQNPNGDELDQHIAKLEGMLGKSEFSSMDLGDLKKTLSDIRSLQVQINLSKSMESIKNTKMGKLSKSISFSPKIQANLPEPAKKSLGLQHDIVNSFMKKYAQDEQKAASDINSILNIEGIIKKD